MEKSVIKKLPNDVINKLTVRSLITGPACVLKELIENSLDAKSSSISVYVNDAGIGLIRVVDNGIGIYKGDLHKICLRFNTSKISNVNDLNNIKTYGFRGESLYLIKSIAKLNIFSKPYDQSSAYKAFFWGGEYDFCIFQDSCINGTIIEVLDLFSSNVNYKLFLNNFDYEFYKLHNIFKIAALSSFDVRFVFFKNGKEVINLPSCSNSFSKLKRIETLSNDFFFEHIVDINFTELEISFTGFIYLNGVKRYSKFCKFFFVNNRIVSSAIIEDIFSNILSLKCVKKFFFGYCLYLYLDASLYDVTISNKKFDIVFKDYYFIYNFLFKIIYNNLFVSKINNNNKSYNNINESLIAKQNTYVETNKFFCINSSKKIFYKFNDSILTIINNTYVFFRLGNKVYIIRMDVIRSRVVYETCCKQFIKFGRILKKDILYYELFDLRVFSVFLEFKDIMKLYGIVFDIFNDKFLIVRSTPIMLYNLSVDWHSLFYDLKIFLEKSMLINFSTRRFDCNIINIFIKHIDKTSMCNLYEVNLFYKELLNAKLNDSDWFNKNCSEVVTK